MPDIPKIKLPKVLRGKDLVKEMDELIKHAGLENVKPDMEKTREILSKIDIHRSMMVEKYGGEMWDELKEWIESNFLAIETGDIIDRIKEIEKQYGIDYTE
jgi:hypothetical protein